MPLPYLPTAAKPCLLNLPFLCLVSASATMFTQPSPPCQCLSRVPSSFKDTDHWIRPTFVWYDFILA